MRSHISKCIECEFKSWILSPVVWHLQFHHLQLRMLLTCCDLTHTPCSPSSHWEWSHALTSGDPHTVTVAFIFNQVQFHPGQHNHTRHTPPENTTTEDWITLGAENRSRSLFRNFALDFNFIQVHHSAIKLVWTVKYYLVHSCCICNAAEKCTSTPTDAVNHTRIDSILLFNNTVSLQLKFDVFTNLHPILLSYNYCMSSISY